MPEPLEQWTVGSFLETVQPPETNCTTELKHSRRTTLLLVSRLILCALECQEVPSFLALLMYHDIV
jgi:hypothetical protein